MKYEVQIIRAAEKEVGKLPAAVRARISQRIFCLWKITPDPEVQGNLAVTKNIVFESAIIESYTL